MLSPSRKVKQQVAFAAAVAAAAACSSTPPSPPRSGAQASPSSVSKGGEGPSDPLAESADLLARDRSDQQWQRAFEVWRQQQTEVSTVPAPNGQGGVHVSGNGDLFPWGQVSINLTKDTPLGPNIVGIPDGNALRAIDSTPDLTAVQRQELTNLASQPQGAWLGYWTLDHPDVIEEVASTARELGYLPMYVLYGINDSESAKNSDVPYQDWASSMLDQIAAAAPDAVVILEPDALPSALSGDGQDRLQKVRMAVELAVERNLEKRLYIDTAGSTWLSPEVAAEGLLKVGVSKAAGWTSNVSGFGQTEPNIAFGQKIRALIKKATGKAKGFLIDTGRNGSVIDNSDLPAPFNLKSASLGSAPTVVRQAEGLDATLRVKPVFQSDKNTTSGRFATERTVPCPPEGEICLPLVLSMAKNRRAAATKPPMALFTKNAETLVLVSTTGDVRVYGGAVGRFDLTVPAQVESNTPSVSKVKLVENRQGDLETIAVSMKTAAGPSQVIFSAGQPPVVDASPGMALTR